MRYIGTTSAVDMDKHFNKIERIVEFCKYDSATEMYYKVEALATYYEPKHVPWWKVWKWWD